MNLAKRVKIRNINLVWCYPYYWAVLQVLSVNVMYALTPYNVPLQPQAGMSGVPWAWYLAQRTCQVLINSLLTELVPSCWI